jgi:hypothetical protein
MARRRWSLQQTLCYQHIRRPAPKPIEKQVPVAPRRPDRPGPQEVVHRIRCGRPCSASAAVGRKKSIARSQPEIQWHSPSSRDANTRLGKRDGMTRQAALDLKLVAALGAIALAVAAGSGCEETSSARTPGERLLAGRDIAESWFWRSGILAYTTAAASGDPETQDFWVRDLAAPGPRLALADVDWAPPVWWPRTVAGDLVITGSYVFRAYDRSRDLATTLVLPPSLAPPAGGGPISSRLRVAVRPDGLMLAEFPEPVTGVDLLRLGRLGEERELRGFSTRALDFIPGGGGGGDSDLVLLGHPTRGPEGSQIMVRFSAADGSLTPLATDLFPAWTPSERFDAIGNCSLGFPACNMLQVLGCSPETPACPETGEPPCAVVFAREAPATAPGAGGAPDEAVLVPAAFDMKTGTELPLGGATTNYGFARSWDRRRVAFTDVTDPLAPGVAVWDACRPAPVRCPLPRSTSAFVFASGWRPDSQAVTAYGRTNETEEGELLVVEGDNCSYPEGSGPHLRGYNGFSSDGTLLSWISGTGSADSTLWLADGSGRGARALATGFISYAVFGPENRYLLVFRSNDRRLSMSAIDLQTPDGRERPLADSVGFRLALGRERALAIGRWNTQDLSGDLTVYDLARGTSTVLASPVSDIAVDGSVDGDATVAYTVHTRFPSGSDGLWLSRLPGGGDRP